MLTKSRKDLYLHSVMNKFRSSVIAEEKMNYYEKRIIYDCVDEFVKNCIPGPPFVRGDSSGMRIPFALNFVAKIILTS